MNLLNNKKAQALKKVGKLIIVGVVVVLLVMFIKSYVWPVVWSVFALVPDSTCANDFAQYSMLDFKREIAQYSAKELKNADNAFYSPVSAISLFNNYIECKNSDKNKFDKAEIAANEPVIISCTASSYINYAKQLEKLVKEGGEDSKFFSRQLKNLNKNHTMFKKNHFSKLTSAAPDCAIS